MITDKTEPETAGPAQRPEAVARSRAGPRPRRRRTRLIGEAGARLPAHLPLASDCLRGTARVLVPDYFGARSHQTRLLLEAPRSNTGGAVGYTPKHVFVTDRARGFWDRVPCIQGNARAQKIVILAVARTRESRHETPTGKLAAGFLINLYPARPERARALFMRPDGSQAPSLFDSSLRWCASQA